MLEGDGKKKSVKDEKNAKRKAMAKNLIGVCMNVRTFYFEDNFFKVCLIFHCVERPTFPPLVNVW